MGSILSSPGDTVVVDIGGSGTRIGAVVDGNVVGVHGAEVATAEDLATAILAGIIAQIVVQPPGALASVPDWLRYGAVAAGFVAFTLARKSIFAGVIVGEVVMIAGKYWLG